MPPPLEPITARVPASLQIEGNGHTLAEAYCYLGITDTSIPDGDVIAAFHARYSENQYNPSTDIKHNWTTRALENIAHRRESQLLAFILTIIPHLTKDNVRLLATPPATPTSVSSITIGEGERLTVTPGSDGNDTPATVAGDLEGPTLPGPTGGVLPTDNKVIKPPSSVLENDSDAGSWDEIVSHTVSADIGTSSSGEDSAEFDFDAQFDSKYRNRHNWCCEDCNSELVNGHCPQGCQMIKCGFCAKLFEPRSCPLHCDECQEELEGPYFIEQDDVEDCDKEDLMVWDNSDKIWRCRDCGWEVEADSENEGYCICFMDWIVMRLVESRELC